MSSDSPLVRALAEQLTGPSVASQSIALELSGVARRGAESFFALRKLLGVSGYMSTHDAQLCIDATLAAVSFQIARRIAVERDLETTLRDLHTQGGDWTDEHDAILNRWRQARGEAGMTGWRWWWRIGDDEAYQPDCDTREAAIAEARREGSPLEIHIVEARSWNDDLLDSEEVTPFAQERNAEVIPVEGAA